MTTKCNACKIPGDLFNGVYDLDCFLTMTKYPVIDPEQIPYLKYLIKKDLPIWNRLNILNKTCSFHQKTDCGWHYWWKFPNEVQVSAFHSPAESFFLGYYAEFKMEIPKNIYKAFLGATPIIFPDSNNIFRVIDYEEFALVMTKAEKMTFET